GVNFVLGAGLHAYAFGTGGLHYVIGAALANYAFLALGIFVRSYRQASRQAAAADAPPIDAAPMSSPSPV
ncbi:MAG: hypothetical protein ACRC1K_25645, partial [Planctomycetia bacterium]